MKQVSKVIVIDNEGKYLLMKRSNHPTFPYDYDLAGGTIDQGEEPIEATVRELEEEIGIKVQPEELILFHTDTSFSQSSTEYFLYVYFAPNRPDITISWEHASYEWVEPAGFAKSAEDAEDTYMHMVAAALKEKTPQKNTD